MKPKVSLLIIFPLVFLTACSEDKETPRGSEEAKDMLESGEYSEKEKDSTSEETDISKEKNSDMTTVSKMDKDNNKEISVTYPEFGLTNVDSGIQQLIDKKLEIFKNISTANEDEGETPVLNINFEKDKVKDHIYALTFNIDSHYAEDSLKEREIVWVNNDTDELLVGEGLFDDSSETKALVYEQLLKEIEKDDTLNIYLRKDKLKEWVNENTTFEEVAIEDNRLNFNFEVDTIAETAAGEPSFDIDISEARHLMPERVQEFIK